MTLPANLVLRFEKNQEKLARGKLPLPRGEHGIFFIIFALAIALGASHVSRQASKTCS